MSTQLVLAIMIVVVLFAAMGIDNSLNRITKHLDGISSALWAIRDELQRLHRD